ncbi:variant surface glycoprotein (VSG, atypical), putative [Trypanosoma equiperdum]|uniref:Variant surface glycoprotein (VSG, atypical), putative n=1 Tax=Trypanosoma equiperdum TaxID=5694 RepID=A0A1G4HY45_TRYEQ|nr:variant surface glycoprotein (VSG, atypical), putative [Trypanosoma equiperdum]
MLANFKALTFVSITLCLPVVTTSAVKTPTKKAKTACDVATQLRQMADSARIKITSTQESVKKMLTTASKLDVIANGVNTNAGWAAAYLRSIYIQKAAEANEKLAANAPALLKGIEALSRLAGSQEAISRLSQLQLQDLNIATATTHATDGSKGQLKPKLEPAVNPHCIAADGTREKDSSDESHDTQHKNAITILTVKATPAGEALGTYLTICGSNSNAGRPPDTANCNSGQATNIGVKGGTVFKATPKVLHTTAANSAEAYGDGGDDESTPNKATIKAELALVLEMLHAAQRLGTITAPAAIESAFDATYAGHAIAKALGGHEATAERPNLKEKVKHTTEELFGKESNSIKTQIPQLLNTFQPSKATGSDGAKTLDSINAPEELSKAATYYTIKNFIDEEEQKKKNQENPSCPTSAEKPEEEHKDEKGCDFDEKKYPKCFPKEKVSTTSTGRNSIVIKTLPLLAVLLLA